MKTFYGVVYVLLEDGTAMQYISTTYAETKPENSFKSTELGDVWVEWLENREEVEKEQAKLQKEIIEARKNCKRTNSL